MKISFCLKEGISFQDVIEDIKSHEYYVEKGTDDDHWGVIEDTDFNSFAEVIFSKEKIEISTAWSGFEYTISENNKRVLVTYNGAYRGLLEQNLLPSILRRFDEDEFKKATVESSLKYKITLLEYAELQGKFWEFRRANDIDSGYMHPHCVWNILKG